MSAEEADFFEGKHERPLIDQINRPSEKDLIDTIARLHDENAQLRKDQVGHDMAIDMAHSRLRDIDLEAQVYSACVKALSQIQSPDRSLVSARSDRSEAVRRVLDMLADRFGIESASARLDRLATESWLRKQEMEG